MKYSILFLVILTTTYTNSFPQKHPPSPVDTLKVIPAAVGEAIKIAGTQAIGTVQHVGATVLHGAGDILESRRP